MIGIISDIHGNLEALEAVLEAGQRFSINRWVCLGDIVGYGPNPVECLELVRSHCDVIVKGNHDDACGCFAEIDEFNQIAKRAILWTIEQLKDVDRDWLSKLPLYVLEEDRMYVHSSPYKPYLWHYIFTESEARRQIQHLPQNIRYCFIGHTHEPFRFVSDNKSELINVGSVGQPRDYDARSCFVVFNESLGKFHFCRVEYDIERTQQKILDRGLPRFLAHRLQLGN
ncbi:MAG: metallophosphatase family protein [bacterium]|nr:metallophosphatase family protein [bacterium]